MPTTGLGSPPSSLRSKESSHEIRQSLPPSSLRRLLLFIGVGVQFSGRIRHAGPQDEKAVILAEYTGDVEWNSVLQVPCGGTVIVEKPCAAGK